MSVIRSPLGALGALMVFLEGIAAVALVPLQSQPELQRLLVLMMVASISAITVSVIFIVVWFAIKRPGLLFNPQDIDPSAHMPLYAPGESPKATAIPSDSISFEVIKQSDEEN